MVFAPADRQPPIYIGVWTNWSVGRVRGITLTLTQRNGILLTTVTGLFIVFASSVLWPVACFAMHQWGTSKAGLSNQDSLYHQRQTILRNAPSGASGFWSLSQLIWSWQGRESRPYMRITPVLFFCAFYWCLFTAASILSSSITDLLSNEVLISSPYCGRYNLDVEMDTKGEPSNRLVSEFVRPRNDKANKYAKTCYRNNTDSIFECRTMVASQVPFEVAWNTSCPFDESICVESDQNVMVDSRVNSLTDLGLNTPFSESIDIRWLNHCGPLKTEGYKDTVETSSGETFTRYFYGPCILKGCNSSATYSSEKRPEAIETYDELASLGPVPKGNRQVEVVFHITLNDSSHKPQSQFDPIPELSTHDADIFIASMTANEHDFLSPVHDPWYASHNHWETYQQNGRNFTRYAADEPSSPLACKMQVQFCSPGTFDCTPLEGIIDAYWRRAGKHEKYGDLILRIFQSLSQHWLGDPPNTLSTRSLQATGLQTRMWSVPDDQWKLDVVFWQQQFLASVQGSMIDAATGTPDKLDDSWKLVSPEHKKFCEMQKIRSAMHLNFSVLTLSLIYAIGGVAIILGWSLDSLIELCDKRRKKRSLSVAEWRNYETMELLKARQQSNCADSDRGV